MPWALVIVIVRSAECHAVQIVYGTTCANDTVAGSSRIGTNM